MARKSPRPMIAKGGTIRLEMNTREVDRFLKSDEMGDVVEEAARSYLLPVVKGLAPRKAEFSVERFVGRDRVRVHVATENVEAMLAEAQKRILTRAVGMVTTGRKPR